MAQYRAGTVTVTTNSASVFGVGTAWLTSGIQPGHWFTIRDEGITYTVAAVLSENQIVLSAAYQGTSQTSVFYLLHTDFTPRGFAVPGPNDVEATMIVRRAIYDIDADLTRNLGSSTGGGTVTISSIKDLNSSTALTGHVLTKLADGSYGFTSPQALGVVLVNMANAATNTGRLYAGISAAGGHQFRALQVVGGTLVENTDRLTLTIPTVGEVNTLASLASPATGAISLVAPKTGTTLTTYGLRGINGVTVVRDGNDVVVSGSGTTNPGGTTGGEANTGENIGPSGSTVLRLYSDKLNTSLRFRTILLNPEHFTVSGELSGQYTVNLRRQRLSDSPDTDIGTAAPGTVLGLDTDNVWRGKPMPAPGIQNLQSDPAPRLGGDLVTGGRRILGIANTISGMIERPKEKIYTLILKSASPILINSVTCTCNVGPVNFTLFLGADLDDGGPEGGLASFISGTAQAGIVSDVIPGDSLLVPIGSRLSLLLAPQTASPEDFLFSVAHTSA